MKKNFLYIIIGLVVIVPSYFLFISPEKTTVTDSQQVSESNILQWETKTDEQQPVAITVTPLELGINQKEWRFDVTFDTHSGSLDDDLAKVITLYDDKGNAYLPLSWAGLGAGGHHRTGILVFAAIKTNSSFVELKIRDVGGIPERSFKWNLN